MLNATFFSHFGLRGRAAMAPVPKYGYLEANITRRPTPDGRPHRCFWPPPVGQREDNGLVGAWGGFPARVFGPPQEEEPEGRHTDFASVAIRHGEVITVEWCQK